MEDIIFKAFLLLREADPVFWLRVKWKAFMIPCLRLKKKMHSTWLSNQGRPALWFAAVPMDGRRSRLPGK